MYEFRLSLSKNKENTYIYIVDGKEVEPATFSATGFVDRIIISNKNGRVELEGPIEISDLMLENLVQIEKNKVIYSEALLDSVERINQDLTAEIKLNFDLVDLTNHSLALLKSYLAERDCSMGAGYSGGLFYKQNSIRNIGFEEFTLSYDKKDSYQGITFAEVTEEGKKDFEELKLSIPEQKQEVEDLSDKVSEIRFSIENANSKLRESESTRKSVGMPKELKRIKFNPCPKVRISSKGEFCTGTEKLFRNKIMSSRSLAVGCKQFEAGFRLESVFASEFDKFTEDTANFETFDKISNFLTIGNFLDRIRRKILEFESSSGLIGINEIDSVVKDYLLDLKNASERVEAVVKSTKVFDNIDSRGIISENSGVLREKEVLIKKLKEMFSNEADTLSLVKILFLNPFPREVGSQRLRMVDKKTSLFRLTKLKKWLIEKCSKENKRELDKLRGVYGETNSKTAAHNYIYALLLCGRVTD